MNLSLENLLQNKAVKSSYVFVTSPKALRKKLRKLQVTKKLVENWNSEKIGRKDVDEFLEQVLAEFETNERFLYEPELAALCVSMEDWDGSYPEEVLQELSEMEFSEIPILWRIAKLCREKRDKKKNAVSAIKNFREQSEPAKTTEVSQTKSDSNLQKELNRSIFLEKSFGDASPETWTFFKHTPEDQTKGKQKREKVAANKPPQMNLDDEPEYLANA